MASKVAQDEKMYFSERLKSSLRAAGLSLRASDFARAFNARADGAAVTAHAARKWLRGEAIPTHEKLVIMAVWLGINAAWLRYGDAHVDLPAGEVIPEANISTPALALMNDIHSLPLPAQQTIRDIVDAFLRHFGPNREQ